ncbi:MAG: glutamyl-tRNA reductase [Myxococcales bacterium]|nr:glutamyl-tRNA reductase [Myxococcales bacterium]MCB9669957.1 glutamyl-tRNA reductase [Alphaproteobacteria bacterium]
MSGELIAVGLSHHTAPVSVRERMAMDEDRVKENLARLHQEGAVSEAFLLSTCNRVELYAVSRDIEAIQEFMREHRGPEGEPIDRYLYWHRNEEAVRHLFRVASSLDSLVVGEPQILGQVKTAIRLAEESKSLGRTLNTLTRQTVSVAKRVRTETRIGESRVGIGNAGVDLAQMIFGGLTGKRALLLGVGEMGRQVSRAMVNAGLEELIVANRTYERSVECAEEHGGTPIQWDRMQEYLGRVDVVIAATGATRPILDRTHVQKALAARRYRSLLLIDLSVPRNIARDVEDLEQAFLYNVDDLTAVMEQGKAERQNAADAAVRLVDEEASRFMMKLKEVSIGQHIGSLTKVAEQIRMEEMERSARVLEGLDPKQRKAVEAMTRAMMKKILHRPISTLRDAAREGDLERIELLMSAWSQEDDS